MCNKCQEIIYRIHNRHIDEPGLSSLTFQKSEEMLPETSLSDSSNDPFSDDLSFPEKRIKINEGKITIEYVEMPFQKLFVAINTTLFVDREKRSLQLHLKLGDNDLQTNEFLILMEIDTTHLIKKSIFRRRIIGYIRTLEQ